MIIVDDHHHLTTVLTLTQRITLEYNPIVEVAIKILEDSLNCSQMGLPLIMHVKTHLLNCIGDIWPHKGKILECTCKTPIASEVTN